MRNARRLPAALLVALLGAALPARADEDRTEMARKLAASLAERGYPVDLEKIRLEEKTAKEIEEDLRAQQGMFFGPTYFEGTTRFFRALRPGLVGDDPAKFGGKEFLEATVAELAKSVPAYYQPGANRLVFRKAHPEDGLARLSDPGYLVAHEMVHAHQDQARGLVAALKQTQGTVESTRLTSCLIEGEAEAVALSLKADLATVSLRDLSSDVERVLAGEVRSIVYSTGRIYMVERFREGGWKAVAAAVRDRLPSTEQILHREKRGKDLPTAVALPAMDLPTIHDDVLGELEIYRVLLLLGIEREEAWSAAAGWDGDRLRVLGDDKGRELVVWRTLWDRPVDAEEFALRLSSRARGEATTRGRVVEWVRGSDAEMEKKARALLDADLPSPPVVEADAASAEEAEKAHEAARGEAASRDGDTWVHPTAGIRVPIPKGWEHTEMQGIPILYDPEAAAATGFAPNINAQSMPLPPGSDADAVLKQNKEQLANFKGIELDFIEKAELGGVPAVRYGFHGKFQPGAPSLRFLGVILLRGDRQVVVTATTSEELWEAQKEMLQKVLDGVRAEPAPEPAKK